MNTVIDSPQTTNSAPVLSTKDWIITLLITYIPIVGFIMLFVWAFGSQENPNKANWAKATLIWMAIVIVCVFLFWGAIVAFVGSNMLNDGI
jgi:hypothetical protein